MRRTGFYRAGGGERGGVSPFFRRFRMTTPAARTAMTMTRMRAIQANGATETASLI